MQGLTWVYPVLTVIVPIVSGLGGVLLGGWITARQASKAWVREAERLRRQELIAGHRDLMRGLDALHTHFESAAAAAGSGQAPDGTNMMNGILACQAAVRSINISHPGGDFEAKHRAWLVATTKLSIVFVRPAFQREAYDEGMAAMNKARVAMIEELEVAITGRPALTTEDVGR